MQSLLMGGCGCGICHDVELNVIGTLAKLYGSRARWAPKKKWAREKKGVTFAEEIAKAMGVLLIFRLLRAEFDNIRDGFVYGALVGLGFNWFEAAGYVAEGYAEYGVAAYGLQLGSQYALFGLHGHVFTGIFGAVLATGSVRSAVGQ